MAVLIEALTVVIRCESIVKKFLGGVEAFKASLPNNTLCSDGELACVNFMVPTDVQNYVEFLSENGLIYQADNSSVDIVVVDQLRGMTSVCDWADYGKTEWNNDANCPISVCCARPTKSEQVIVPEGWSFNQSLSSNYKYTDSNSIPEHLKLVRSEGEIDILLDEKTGQEFYIRRG